MRADARDLSVSELTAKIRGTLEPAFSDVWVRGEVSNYRPAPSGHAYFTLKDAGASLSVACFGWGARKRAFELKDGIQILCHGKVSVYPPRGNYQLSADHLEPLGAGALQLEFENLKAKLDSEGLFSSARKRPIPRYPRWISVITSPSGAAVRDMVSILERRAPRMRVTVVPALVQGDQAAAQIARAIEGVGKHRIGEVLVLARGGGSIEDLWCFNDERLARAIAACPIPVISAVGHEIDFTISDFVADLRAPTPSAAAEIVSQAWVETESLVQDLTARLGQAMRRGLVMRRQTLQHVAARLINPRDRLREQAQRLDELFARLGRAMRISLERKSSILAREESTLRALSPLKVLDRGYLIAAAEGGTVVGSARDLRVGDRLSLRFKDGTRQAKIEG